MVSSHGLVLIAIPTIAMGILFRERAKPAEAKAAGHGAQIPFDIAPPRIYPYGYIARW
jgi:hypothetical protein